MIKPGMSTTERHCRGDERACAEIRKNADTPDNAGWPYGYKKAKLAHNKLTEQLAEKMKEEGITDLLIMSAGPYKHNSCMSAYCVDAQKMADAAGMLCWTSDGMIRYFSQVLFRG